MTHPLLERARCLAVKFPDQLDGQGFNETLQGFSPPSIFHRLSSVVKNRLKGILDVTCINVALPGLICLLCLSILYPSSFTISSSVSVSISDPPCLPPICPAPPLCHSAIQHIKEPWLVQSTRRPPVSFTPGPNEKCPLSFSLPPFDVLPSTGERGRAGWL